MKKLQKPRSKKTMVCLFIERTAGLVAAAKN